MSPAEVFLTAFGMFLLAFCFVAWLAVESGRGDRE